MPVINTKQKPNFKGVQLPPVSQGEFDKYIDIYNKKYDKFDHGAILDDVFKRFKSDKNVLGMYIKCIMIDKFYSTNIKFIDELVHHLVSIKNLHKRIDEGKLDVIYKMQKVKKPDGKHIHYRSFVSKYCRRYNPQAYPIYDSYVKEVLEYYLEYYINQDPTFYEDAAKKVKQDYDNNGKIWKKINWQKITSNDWLDYKKYVQIVDTFIMAHPFITTYANANKMSPYVVFDAYLWTMGKEKIEGIRLYNQIQTAKSITDPVKQEKKLAEIRNKLNMPNNATIPELEDEVENIYF